MSTKNPWRAWLRDADGPALAGRVPALGLLENIRSAWNVGSMFRSADAAGLAGLVLCGLTPTPPRPDIEKTALGATLSVPWDYWPDAEACAASLHDAGVAVVALETAAAADTYDAAGLPFPHCFVVGHEVRGVSPAILDLADAVRTIPMAGAKGSLNVAVSFGIMAYEVRRQWRARLSTSTAVVPDRWPT